MKIRTSSPLHHKVLKSLPPATLLMLTIAGIINAFGVVLFLSPVRLYDSGISGTSMLFAQMTGLPLSLFLIVLNIPLFLYGLRRQGLSFTVRSIYTVIVYSAASALFGSLLTGEPVSPFSGGDLLLCAVFGGIISGIGSGTTIRWGGAIDGMEVLAVTFAKGLGITVGTFVMIYFVVNRFQIAKMRSIVHDIDDHAFISITEVSDLFGKNAK